MQPISNPQPSPVVNWSIPGQFIDQLPAAVVVVNSPPFRGLLITCRPHCLHWPRHVPTKIARWPAAVVGYAVLVPAERIARQKRHGSTAAELDVFLLGGTNVIS
jgi:hypothetical protein